MSTTFTTADPIVVIQTGQRVELTLAMTPTTDTTISAYEILDPLPTGLSFVAPDLIQGIATSAAVTNFDVQHTQVAADGTATTTTTDCQLVVLQGPGDPLGNFGLKCNLDIPSRELTFPGLAADQLPRFSSRERLDFDLGIFDDETPVRLNIGQVKVTFKQLDVDEPILLNTPTSFVTDGDRTSVPVYFDPDTLSDSLARGVNTDITKVAGRLQLEVAGIGAEVDARAFDTTETAGTFTIDQGESINTTETFDLDATWQAGWTDIQFSAIISLVVPGDSGLDIEFTRALVVNESGGSYTVTATGPTSGTGSSATPADWDTSLVLDAVTGTGTGLSIETTLTTDAQTTVSATVDPVRWSIIDSGGNWVLDEDGAVTDEAWDFIDGGSSVGSFFASPGTTYTNASLAAAIESQVGLSGITVQIDEFSITIYGLTGVSEVDVNDGSTHFTSTITEPGSPSYSNAIVSTRLIGLAHNTRVDPTIISLATPVELYRDHD